MKKRPIKLMKKSQRKHKINLCISSINIKGQLIPNGPPYGNATKLKPNYLGTKKSTRHS